jgi:hypothetical protein
VALHGGKITVTSAGLGKGTTFTVVLPVIQINDDEADSVLVNPAADPLLNSLPGIGNIISDQTATALGTTAIKDRVLKRLLVVDDSLPNRSRYSHLFWSMTYFRQSSLMLHLLTTPTFYQENAGATADF